MFFFFHLGEDSNHLNTTVRWTVACRRLDDGNTFISQSEMSIESSLGCQKERHTFQCVFLFRPREGSNHLNATVRWTAPCRRLDGGNSFISHSEMYRVLSGVPQRRTAAESFTFGCCFKFMALQKVSGSMEQSTMTGRTNPCAHLP